MESPTTSQNISISALEWFYLGLTLLAVAFILILRSYGAYPSVMPDEFFHSKFSRLMPLADVEIPGYLYYAVYSATVLWGENFIEGARILNAIFYSSGGLFIYLIARAFLPKWTSIFIMLASLAMPTNFYVSHFMPEAMYFFLFWVLQFVVLTKYRKTKFGAVWVGVLLGALALIKPHAIFLLPVYAIYMAVCRGFTLSAVADITQFLVAFILVRLGMGLSLAGNNGFSFFGNSYTEHAERATGDFFILLDSFPSILLNLSGHVVVLCYLFGIGVVYLITTLKNSEPLDEKQMHVLLFLHMVILIPIISVFTSSVAIFEGDVDNRLHMRYYSFVLPYFFLIIGQQVSMQQFDPTKFFNVFIGMFVAMMAFALMYYNSTNKFFYPFAIGIVDVPELFLITQNRIYIYLIGVLSIISVAVAFKNQKTSQFIYACLLLPLFLAGTWFSFLKISEARFEIQEMHLAGQKLRETLPKSTQDSLMVVGHRLNAVYATVMFADSDKVRYEQLSTVTPFDVNMISKDTRYILTLDSLDLTPVADVLWKLDYARLYKLRD